VLALWEAAEAQPSVTDDRPGLDALLAADPRALLVAERDGAVVGCVVAAWDGWRGSVYRLAVLPAHRRRGIGSALVRAAVAALRERGARRVGALVVITDRDAVAFWDSLRAAGVTADARPKRRYVAGGEQP